LSTQVAQDGLFPAESLPTVLVRSTYYT
jgi:hypothetical protein